ncbi:leucine-rich repeat and fibronectin type-III domain-containing protein 3 [Temnothorax americanus]|uniref:leucine-rich repeat and fibronectin type-III domain-containing protein 3 n=1 Tax=Temnothorax americanus TaxID=1964332 RepID=UPI004068F0AC
MLVTRPHPLGGRILLALFLLTGCFALLSRAAAFPDWTDCPAVCRCKWTSGKKSALCPDAGLTSLPASLDPDMQVLDLSGNRIPALQAEIFKLAGLVNLQRVFLRNAGIHSIHADSFKDMRILIEIDLSDNHVTVLEPNTFLGNERLRVLILSGNPLGTLRNLQFPMLQHLRNLELQRCSLTEVHGQAFAQLAGLEFLKLDTNKLEYLEASVISGLSRLKTLTLDGNQWRCDCRLRDFRTWLIPDTPSKLYSAPQICSNPPRLQGRRWEDVKATEFACEPKVFVLASSIQEETNGNLSLACRTSGDPEPEVWWQLNGGPVNATKSTDQPYMGTLVVYTTSEAAILSNDKSASRTVADRWSNLTVYNASDSDAGEYVCFAKNIAGLARDTVNVAIPRVYTAPTLSQSDNWLLWVSLAGGGAAAACASISAILLVLCLCGGSRRQSKREKVKLQSSGSFGDQEKKLLDLSVTTTTPGNSNDRGSNHDSLGEACSTGDLELAERGSICDPMAAAAVTVERLRPADSSVNAIRAVPCAAAAGVFPPPPPEFTTGVLPAGIFGNIFISVSLPQDASSERCYPDLLDIPVHAVSGTTATVSASSKTAALSSAAINVSSFATLPRRALRSAEVAVGSPYDNMGPRITANGSSAFSLTDMTDLDLRLSPPPPPRIIQPPHEFVSL